MRTDKEILDRIEFVKESDWMGTETSDLLIRLSFDVAKPFLVEGAEESEWKMISRDRDYVLDEMFEYMSFAWDKANNGRGLSASRSMRHFSAWTWLIGDDDKLPNLNNYEFYGKDNLKDNLCAICKLYGWDSNQWDDGERVNTCD